MFIHLQKSKQQLQSSRVTLIDDYPCFSYPVKEVRSLEPVELNEDFFKRIGVEDEDDLKDKICEQKCIEKILEKATVKDVDKMAEKPAKKTSKKTTKKQQKKKIRSKMIPRRNVRKQLPNARRKKTISF